MILKLKTCCDCGIPKPVGPGGAFYANGAQYAHRCRQCDNANRAKRLRTSVARAAPVVSGEPASYEQIAAELGLTVQGVRDVERRALWKLARNRQFRKEWAE